MEGSRIMPKVDVLHRNGKMVTAKPHGKPWGRAEKDETLGWKITTVETDLPIQEIKSRYKVKGSELELLPEAEWRESILTKQEQMADVEARVQQVLEVDPEILKSVDDFLRGLREK